MSNIWTLLANGNHKIRVGSLKSSAANAEASCVANFNIGRTVDVPLKKMDSAADKVLPITKCTATVHQKGKHYHFFYDYY